MKGHNTEDRIVLADIAGYATELTVWRFIADITAQLLSLRGREHQGGCLSLDSVVADGKRFILEKPCNVSDEADVVWALGACIYELFAGAVPFGGRGRDGQTSTSPLPSFGEAMASESMNRLMQQCLSCNKSARPKLTDILDIAKKGLPECESFHTDVENLKFKKPQNRKIRMKSYSYWPEAMSCIILLLFMGLTQNVHAQDDAEMVRLIRLTTMMRDQSKRAEVLKELKADTKWTLMDELDIDFNECTYGDQVDMFGINDIAAEIAQRERGIVNVGGRFRNSADGVHHYSFIELTAKAGTSVTFSVWNHKGVQKVAIIPFDIGQDYSASFFTEGDELKAETIKDGISFYSFKVGKRGHYEFQITNEGSKNASFAVITYNPME